jgi:hypothetical protein
MEAHHLNGPAVFAAKLMKSPHWTAKRSVDNAHTMANIVPAGMS